MKTNKICSRCKKEKDRDEFKRDFQCTDNRRSCCKECDNMLAKQWRDKKKQSKMYDLI